MRKLLLSLFLSLLALSVVEAQSVGTFSNGIFKTPDSEDVIQNQSEVSISDFKYQDYASRSDSPLLHAPRTNPGIAFAASAIIPGSGQAVNGKWVRAGIYFATEVAGLIYHFNRNALARKQEKAYESFTHENWSVVAYAQWIVRYSDQYGLNQSRLSELRDMVFNENGMPISPDYSNTTNDWQKVNIGLLHDVENETPFIFENPTGCAPDECRRASEFSHELPKYGSQQYYELISKYYQYQPGWKDWYNQITTNPNQQFDLYRYMWDGEDEPNTLFYQGRDRAQEFNDNYRAAGNILKLLLVNHVVSAFDALFTVQLKNSRIETNTNLMRLEQFSVTWHF